MPIFHRRRRNPLRRVRLAWLLAGCLMAVAARDWAKAVAAAIEVLRLLGRAAVADGSLAAVEPVYRAAGAARLLVTADDLD